MVVSNNTLEMYANVSVWMATLVPVVKVLHIHSLFMYKSNFFFSRFFSFMSIDPFLVQCLPVPVWIARMVALQCMIQLLVSVNASATMASLGTFVKVGDDISKGLPCIAWC